MIPVSNSDLSAGVTVRIGDYSAEHIRRDDSLPVGCD